MSASIILIDMGERLVGRQEGGELLRLVVVQSHAVTDEGCLCRFILVEQLLGVL